MKYRINQNGRSRTYRSYQKMYERRIKVVLFTPLVLTFLYALVVDANKVNTPYVEAEPIEEVQEVQEVIEPVAPVVEPVEPVEPVPEPTPAPTPKDIVKSKSDVMFGEKEWSSLEELILNESSWNPQARNSWSGACGLFQRYPCNFSNDQLSDINFIADNGLNYIQGRYGTPSKALYFWKYTSVILKGRNWY